MFRSSTALCLCVVILVLPLATPARSQETAADPEVEASPEAVQKPSLRDILDVILLPRVAEEARREGVPEGDIQVVIDASRERRLPAHETREVLEQTTEAVKANGPIDNFGAFVRARLDQGLRGRDLAEAIRVEHRARGKGKGHEASAGKGKPHDDDEEHGGRPEREQSGGQEKSGKAKEKGEGGSS